MQSAFFVGILAALRPPETVTNRSRHHRVEATNRSAHGHHHLEANRSRHHHLHMRGCVFAMRERAEEAVHHKYCLTGLTSCRAKGKRPSACLAEPLPGWPGKSRLDPYPADAVAMDRALAHIGGGLGPLLARFSNRTKGAPPRVTVLGGSMTAGGNIDGIGKPGDKTSAWWKQLEELLTMYYGRPVPLELQARGATSLAWATQHIGEMVPAHTELLLVDYLQNDVRPAMADLLDDGAAGDEKFSLTAEAFVLALEAVFKARGRPSPAVIWFQSLPAIGFLYNATGSAFRPVWAQPDKARSLRRALHGHSAVYENIARHYDQTAISLHRVIWPTPASGEPEHALREWSNCCGPTGLIHVDHHPSWLAHKLCADVVFHAWQRIEQAVLGHSHAAAAALAPAAAALAPAAAALAPVAAAPPHRRHRRPHNGTLNDAGKLRLLGRSCASLGYTVTARAAAARARAAGFDVTPLRADPAWRLVEESSASGGESKPGWVAEGAEAHGAEIAFVLNCESEKRMGFDYLRSGSIGSGSATVHIEAFDRERALFYSSWHARDNDVARKLNSSARASRRTWQNPQPVRLHSHWDQPASLIETKVVDVNCYRLGMDTSPVLATLRFHCDRNHTAATATGSGCRFKLGGLFTCGASGVVVGKK
jgi:hypothetical protein